MIKSLLREELQRLRRLENSLINELQDIPRGSISEKKRNTKNYYYRVTREKNKIVFHYIGKEGSRSVNEAKKQYQARKELNERIRSLSQKIRELEKMLRESR